jgi:hypothetical protein
VDRAGMHVVDIKVFFHTVNIREQKLGIRFTLQCVLYRLFKRPERVTSIPGIYLQAIRIIFKWADGVFNL